MKEYVNKFEYVFPQVSEFLFPTTQRPWRSQQLASTLNKKSASASGLTLISLWLVVGVLHPVTIEDHLRTGSDL